MNNIQSIEAASYELVAVEYYDSVRHPTCANFREASSILFRKWFNRIADNTRVCEIGAGKSLVAEILTKERRSLRGLVLIDESPSMLSYSEIWKEEGVKLVIGSASALPCGSDSLDVVASCLGDPYNSIALWNEVHRVLKPNGRCLFTTPSYDWAQAFREGTEMKASEFELRDGSHILLPSYIYSEKEQVRLIESADLKVSDISSVSTRDLCCTKLSPKLVSRHGAVGSVVTGYVAFKQ
jgi:SAM-dependent methyltransferase